MTFRPNVTVAAVIRFEDRFCWLRRWIVVDTFLISQRVIWNSVNLFIRPRAAK